MAYWSNRFQQLTIFLLNGARFTATSALHKFIPCLSICGYFRGPSGLGPMEHDGKLRERSFRLVMTRATQFYRKH